MSPNDVFKPPAEDWQPRLMVIDGCNIGRSASGHTRQNVSCAGLLSVVRWLLLRDFDCVIFLPVVYKSVDNPYTSNSFLLQRLEAAGLVTFTPARVQNQDRRAFINYDDLYVGTLAHRHGGCILSRDKFQDIINCDEYRELHDVLRHRVVDVHFTPLEETLVQFGDDIFYQSAPELYLPINIGVRATIIAATIFAPPDDMQFDRIMSRRRQFLEHRSEYLRLCDDLFLELCERERLLAKRMLAFPTHHPPSQYTSSGGESDTPDRDDPPTSGELSWLQESNVEQEEPRDNHNEQELDNVPVGTLIDFSTEENIIPTAYSSLDYVRDLDIVFGTLSMTEAPLTPLRSSDSVADLAIELASDRINKDIYRNPDPLDMGEDGEFVEDREQEAVVHTNRETEELFRALSDIFPVDIVRVVLLGNASRNLDFLAGQCLEKLAE